MKIFNVLALSILLALLAACGDESSSSAPDPIGEISSSSNDDNGSASSSSQKDSKKSSSSVAEKNSSSSVSGMNSSSSVVESSSSARNSSSSSAILFKQCEEGDTVISEMGLNVFYYRCHDNEWVLDSTVNVVKPKVYPNMDSVFNPAVTYGSFKDPRDGKVYDSQNSMFWMAHEFKEKPKMAVRL